MLSVKNPETYDWKNIPLLDCVEGNAMDSIVTLELYNLLLEKIEENNLTNLFENLVSESQVYLTEAEFEGQEVDSDEVEKIEEELTINIKSIEEELIATGLFPEDINFNSDQQVGDVFFMREDGLALYAPYFTDTGAPSLNNESRQFLRANILIELKNRGVSVDGLEV